jgi:hypothetical protein
MALRKGHGNGAGVPRVEVLPPDELPPASPSIADRPDRGPDGRFLPGNRAQRSKLVRPGPRGFAGLAVDPAFRPFQRWGRRYAAHRRAELAAAHGGTLSAGVGALIESAGAQLAASRFLQARASETGDPALFRQASALSNDARQNELAAWELAAREAQARRTHEPPAAAFWEAAARASKGAKS